MDFLIRHETSSYLRVQSRKGCFSRTQAQALRAALPRISGVSRVRLYPASGGIALAYSGDREEVLQALRALAENDSSPEPVPERIEEAVVEEAIGVEELGRRKLSPAVKARMRRKMILEAAADVLMPMPVQVGYHVCQFIRLHSL